MNDKPKTKRWYQFSLRTMFVVVTIACVLLAGGESSLDWIRQWYENQRVLAALDETTTLTFDESSLDEIIDYVKAAHRIEIQVSVAAMPERFEAPITCNLRGVKLKSGLEQILHPSQRTFIVQDGALLIVTKDELQGTSD